jgi:MoaA/NifB/PqqE/SkfB family radical SAM enzyme
MTAAPRLTILWGWRRHLSRIPFLLRTLTYASRRSRFPLFRLLDRSGGLGSVLRLEASLHLTKTLRVAGRSYTTPSLPGYPSPAFEAAVARGGLDFASAGTPRNRYIGQVILGISPACTYACAHCYEKGNLRGADTIPMERWSEVIRQVQEAGAGVVVLSGGEPMLRFDTVIELLRRADKDRSDFHLHTAGNGVTPERARALREAGLRVAAVGLDDVDEARHDRLRGSPGAFRRAVAALEHFASAGLLACTNLCLTRELVRSGGLWRYFDLMKDLGVGLIQLLEPKPCGGYLGQPAGSFLEPEDLGAVREFVRLGNRTLRYAAHPLLYHLGEVERSPQIGCAMGGLSHFAIDSTGQVVPCVFTPVSFGSILQEDLPPILARMREAVPRPIHGGCPSVRLGTILAERARGGASPAVPFRDLESLWHSVLYEARPTGVG